MGQASGLNQHALCKKIMTEIIGLRQSERESEKEAAEWPIRHFLYEVKIKRRNRIRYIIILYYTFYYLTYIKKKILNLTP